MPSILVFGVDRSSTTLLYQSVRGAVAHPLAVHDLRSAQQLSFAAGDPHRNKVIGVMAPLSAVGVGDMAWFDERFVVVRHPLDALVAEMVGSLIDLVLSADDPASLIDRVRALRGAASLAALEQLTVRPDEPAAVDVVSGSFERCADVLDRYPAAVLVRHEALLVGDAGPIGDDFEHEFEVPDELPAHLFHTPATAAAAIGPRWLAVGETLPDRLATWARRFGYEPSAASTAGHDPVPELADELTRLLGQAAAVPRHFDTLRDRDVYTEAYVEHIRDAISDGYEGAMIEFALINRYGFIDVPNWQDQYIRWMRAAMRRGNPSALIHWGVALERRLATDREHGPGHYFASAAAQIGNPATKRRTATIRALYDRHSPPER